MEDGPVRELSADAVSDSDTMRELEASNLPAVFISGVGNWPAISCWDPARGGLHHLKNLAGSKMVQSMTSNSGSAFYGHIRGHDRVKLVAVSFGAFIDRITSPVSGCGSRPPVASEGNEVVIPVCDMPIDKVEANSENKSGEGEQELEHRVFDGQLYLAQVPIFSRDAAQETTLSPLMQDIEMPFSLETNRVSDINLWMSMTDSRSSTHYDPYHNLLCVVAGEKKVRLWPPSAAPLLYPLRIDGEASNHSGVDFVQPDYKAHPLFHKALSVARLVTLHPGDALFIPEGWYHQVDNFGVTIAVNFWWPSKIALALGTHMDAYFFRRILVNLVDQEKDRMLGKNFFHHRKQRDLLFGTNTDQLISGPTPAPNNEDREEISLLTVDELQDMSTNCANAQLTDSMVTAQNCTKKSVKLEDLTALETYNLNNLVETLSRISARIPSEGSQAVRLDSDRETSSHCNSPFSPELLQENSKMSCEGVLPRADSIARVFSASTALSLQRILLVMASSFPRMLEALMLSLSPSAAEILTRKFEELDASTEQSSQTLSRANFLLLQGTCSLYQIPEHLRNLSLQGLGPLQCRLYLTAGFYEQFYGAFESPDAVMETLLNGKEAFSAQALHNVLSHYLGIDLRGSSFFS